MTVRRIQNSFNASLFKTCAKDWIENSIYTIAEDFSFYRGLKVGFLTVTPHQTLEP